jgi:hypothetical protein
MELLSTSKGSQFKNPGSFSMKDLMFADSSLSHFSDAPNTKCFPTR